MSLYKEVWALVLFPIPRVTAFSLSLMIEFYSLLKSPWVHGSFDKKTLLSSRYKVDP